MASFSDARKRGNEATAALAAKPSVSVDDERASLLKAF